MTLDTQTIIAICTDLNGAFTHLLYRLKQAAYLYIIRSSESNSTQTRPVVAKWIQCYADLLNTTTQQVVDSAIRVAQLPVKDTCLKESDDQDSAVAQILCEGLDLVIVVAGASLPTNTMLAQIVRIALEGHSASVAAMHEP